MVTARAFTEPSLRTDEVAREATRLVVVAPRGGVRVEPFAALPRLLSAGDLVVVNDAATLPASLPGHTADGRRFELRLSGPIDGHRLEGVLLGAGDHRTRTEHRGAPPVLAVGDRVRVGALELTVRDARGRLVGLEAHASDDALWHELYEAGAPIQYAHRRDKLPLWTVQTSYASRPWAVEMPSAGRPLTWDTLLALRRAGIALATLTHAAGLSSTGVDALDRALPWPERYEIPARTAAAIAATKQRGSRIIAIGTSVVRALEASAGQPGPGVATLRIEPAYRPQIVDALVSGLHAPGESHFDLLSAFAPRAQLEHALELAAAHGLSSHELGDACLVGTESTYSTSRA